VDGDQSATTLEDMALDTWNKSDGTNLIGHTVCLTVHAMAAYLEHQGERVTLLAMMDSIPKHSIAKVQLTNEELEEDTLWFVNRVGNAPPESARPYLERFQQVWWQISQLSGNPTYMYPKCDSGMIPFRAMMREELISSTDWKPLSWEGLMCLISIVYTMKTLMMPP